MVLNLSTQLFQGKRVLVTGGTGSLGKALVEKLIALGAAQVRIFSRDEEKQYNMKTIQYAHLSQVLDFQIGDIRNLNDVVRALQDIDIVFNTAALKQVPTCEFFPFQALQTNCIGAENIVIAIEQYHLPVEIVVGIGTDKACKPINAMGISKAMQEKILLSANMRCPDTRFVCARYGNILGSRGSLIPVFQQQIHAKNSITITSPKMTRFLMSLDEAIALIFKAAETGWAGEIFIPKPIASKITDIAYLFSEKYDVPIKEVGIRPGEKLAEILVNEEESIRLVEMEDHYIIVSALPLEVKRKFGDNQTPWELSSDKFLVHKDMVKHKLIEEGLL